MRVATLADKAEIEAMVNHPEVLPSITFDGMPAFDATPYLTEPNIALMMKGGCFLGAWNGMGRFEAHTIFLPEYRGQIAKLEAELALRYVFLHTDCHEVATKVPTSNKGAEHFARALGFRMLFVREFAWPVGPLAYHINYYQLGIDDWIVQGHCKAAGSDFHNRLHSLLPDLETHCQETIHDCYVGAAVELIKAGYVDKAILFYNRWALLAGYQQIMKVSDNPLVLDAKEFLITVSEGDFTVRTP